jgi:nitrate/nitrite transporter NarK
VNTLTVLGETGKLDVGYPVVGFSLQLPNEIPKFVTAKPTVEETGPFLYWEIVVVVVVVLTVVAIVAYLVFRKLRQRKAVKTANGKDTISSFKKTSSVSGTVPSIYF